MNILDYGEPDILALILCSSLLSEGHSVRVVDSLLNGGEALLSSWSHANFEFVRGDLCDHGVLKTARSIGWMWSFILRRSSAIRPALASQSLRAAPKLEASDALLEAKKAGVSRFVCRIDVQQLWQNEGYHSLN